MLLTGCGDDPEGATPSSGAASPTSAAPPAGQSATESASPEQDAVDPDEDSNTVFADEEERERLELANRDLAVEMSVPAEIEAGVAFDVDVDLTVQSLGADGVDFSFVLPEGIEIVAGGVCPAGGGNVDCVDAVAGMTRFDGATVTMVWNPPPGVDSAVIEPSVTDEAIAVLGMDAADGSPDNNTTTATLKVAG